MCFHVRFLHRPPGHMDAPVVHLHCGRLHQHTRSVEHFKPNVCSTIRVTTLFHARCDGLLRLYDCALLPVFSERISGVIDLSYTSTQSLDRIGMDSKLLSSSGLREA